MRSGWLRVGVALAALVGGGCLRGQGALEAARQGDCHELLRRYHLHSSHGPDGVLLPAPSVEWPELPAFEGIPGGHPVTLDPPQGPGRLGIGEALARAGRPATAPGERPLERAALGRLLFHAAGITGERHGLKLRAAASAGGLAPVEVHVALGPGGEIPAGLYHFGPQDGDLGKVGDADAFGRLVGAVEVPSRVRGAAAMVVLTARLARNGEKYGDRAFRYVLLDAGHVLANLLVAAAEEGIDAAPLARFEDGAVEGILGVDPAREAVVVLVALGASTSEGGPVGGDEDGALVGEALPSELAPGLGVSGLAYQATSLVRRQGEARAAAPVPSRPGPLRGFADPPPEGAPGPSPRVSLPRPRAASLPTSEAIRRRRSWRMYSPRMSLEGLSSMLAHASVTRGSALDGAGFAPGLDVRVVASAVDGLDPGVYRHDREEHALVLLRPGSRRDELQRAGVGQALLGRAPAAFVLLLDLEEALAAGGPRGYRDAFLRAGHFAGRVYLAAEGGGLVACSVGGFYDAPALEVAAGDPARQVVAQLCAFGRRP